MACAADDELGPLEFPIDGELDLHAFAPAEIGELVVDYVHECQRRGILELRIVHGKGIGVQRERVHAILRRLQPAPVHSFRLADASAGSWGATLVILTAIPPVSEGS